jgi:hypothetical protein
MFRKIGRLRLGFVLPAIVLVTCTGCVSVAWLPDSSGFIYSAPLGQAQHWRQLPWRLMHYDVSTKKTCIVREKVPAYCPWPALSADGKEIAMAAVVGKNRGKPMLTIIFYDLATGKEMRRSAEFAWLHDVWGAPRANEMVPTGVFWHGDNILVHDFKDLQSVQEISRTGIYNVKKDTMITLEGRPMAIGGSPVRPDGKGFLISKGLRASGQFSVVDWHGKVQDIRLAANFFEVTTGTLREDHGFLQDPWMFTSRWKGPIAEIVKGESRILMDTEKHAGAIEAIPDDQAKVNGHLLMQQFAFPKSKVQVRVLLHGSYDFRVESVKENKVTLVAKTLFPPVFAPSPDGKWLAVRTVDKASEIFLINHLGESERIPEIGPK